MHLNQYQDNIRRLCPDNGDNFSFLFLGLLAHLGHFASRVAKALRRNEGSIRTYKDERGFLYQNDFTYHKEKYETALKKDAQMMLFFLAQLCDVMGWRLEDLAQENIETVKKEQHDLESKEMF